MTRPLRNRVDPFGALHAVPERGDMLGNRGGRFHRPDQTLGARRWASRQWICCMCAFKGRRRPVWGAGYTELFFLDEVTALAAGHRPCFECRRAEALAFQAVFGGGAMRAGEIDRVLHGERLAGAHVMADEELPDGATIVQQGAAFAVRGACLLPWSFAGYGAPQRRLAGAVDVLTPLSIIAALQRGYRPRWRLSN